MAKKYIGSQEHFENEVNAYFDQKEQIDIYMQKQYENDMVEQMERDFYQQPHENDQS